MDAHSFAARNFAHLYAVGGRQHSMDTVAKMQRLALYKWVSNMDVSIKQFDCYTCEFNALQSGTVIKVEDVEVDNNALEQALKQIIDDHRLTRSAQRVYIRKFTIRQDDRKHLIENNFFSAKLNGVANPKGENYFYPCEVKIGKFALERIEDYNPDGAGTGELTFFDVPMILYNEGIYSAKLDMREE